MQDINEIVSKVKRVEDSSQIQSNHETSSTALNTAAKLLVEWLIENAPIAVADQMNGKFSSSRVNG